MIRLFRVFIPISTFTLFVADILLTSLAFFAATYALADVDPTDYLFYDGGIMGILAVTAMFVLGLYFSGLYSGVYVKSKIIMLYQLFLVTGLTFLFEGLISSVALRLRLPIRVMLLGSVLSVSVIYAWRLFFSRYASRILGNARVLLVGSDPVVEALSSYIGSHPHSGLRVAGCVLEEGSPLPSVPGAPSLGYMDSLPDIVQSEVPSSIVVGTRMAATAEVARVLEDLRHAGQNVQDAAATYEKVCGRVWVRGIAPEDLIYSSRFMPPTRHFWVQRFVAAVVGFAGTVVFLPVLILVWLLLRISRPGPVLAGEPRVGLNNKPFLKYRFCIDSKADGRSGLPVLIKFRLDALPQVFNLLKGDMALVGPRAERPEFVEVLSQVIPYYPQRHCVRPGITGWAQIQGAEAIETLAALEFDLYYIKNMSMSLDTLVIFQTLRTLFLEPSEE